MVGADGRVAGVNINVSFKRCNVPSVVTVTSPSPKTELKKPLTLWQWYSYCSMMSSAESDAIHPGRHVSISRCFRP
jgi:hypothetical protein